MGRREAFAYLTVGFVVTVIFTSPIQAQLNIGAVQNVTLYTSCPTNRDQHFASGMTCYHATVHGCSNAVDKDLDFGYMAPTGTPNGVIVLLSGAGGENASAESENTFAHDYVSAGYEVIELAWTAQWEDTGDTTGDSTYGIKYAACRPATFLNYIYNTYYLPIKQGPHNPNPNAGMCAQGFSAGSGALGYALAFYGAGSDTSRVYLDKVELLSGPVFSDIEQGCVVPTAPNVTVCQGSLSWCKLGTQTPWSQAPAYTSHPLNSIRIWTGDNTCGGSSNTSTTSNGNWEAMSIATDPSTNFSYPNTKVTGWLCASVYQNGTMNNSSPEGQLFYTQLASTNTPLAVYAVQNCGFGGRQRSIRYRPSSLE